MSNFNKAFLLLSLLLISLSDLNADETKCHAAMTGTNEKNSLSELVTSCAAAKSLITNETISTHKQLVLEKLSQKVAKGVLQNLEELSLLTTFFNSSSQDLLMNNDRIKRSCKLTNLDNIEGCNGKKGRDLRSEKLAMLKKYLTKSSTNTDRSVSQILADKYITDLMGIKSKEKTLQCPINEDSTFAISGQLTAISGDYIISEIKSAVSKKNMTGIKNLFYKYPQLKIIYDADTLETPGGVLNDFIDHINKAPDDKKLNSKDYISKFLFGPKNQQNGLSDSVAAGCEKNQERIYKYLCEDLSEVVSLDSNVSEDLFDNLNTTDPLEEQRVKYIDILSVLDFSSKS